MKSEETSPKERYDEAVGDGTRAPKVRLQAEPVVVESNASNYGASAVPSPAAPSEAT